MNTPKDNALPTPLPRPRPAAVPPLLNLSALLTSDNKQAAIPVLPAARAAAVASVVAAHAAPLPAKRDPVVHPIKPQPRATQLTLPYEIGKNHREAGPRPTTQPTQSLPPQPQTRSTDRSRSSQPPSQHRQSSARRSHREAVSLTNAAASLSQSIGWILPDKRATDAGTISQSVPRPHSVDCPPAGSCHVQPVHRYNFRCSLNSKRATTDRPKTVRSNNTTPAKERTLAVDHHTLQHMCIQGTPLTSRTDKTEANTATHTKTHSRRQSNTETMKQPVAQNMSRKTSMSAVARVNVEPTAFLSLIKSDPAAAFRAIFPDYHIKEEEEEEHKQQENNTIAQLTNRDTPSKQNPLVYSPPIPDASLQQTHAFGVQHALIDLHSPSADKHEEDYEQDEAATAEEPKSSKHNEEHQADYDLDDADLQSQLISTNTSFHLHVSDGHTESTSPLPTSPLPTQATALTALQLRKHRLSVPDVKISSTHSAEQIHSSTGSPLSIQDLSATSFHIASPVSASVPPSPVSAQSNQAVVPAPETPSPSVSEAPLSPPLSPASQQLMSHTSSSVTATSAEEDWSL